jgi:hypothetical protein
MSTVCTVGQEARVSQVILICISEVLGLWFSRITSGVPQDGTPPNAVTTVFHIPLNSLITEHLTICLTLDNDQLDAQILIHLLQSSTCTCFEQYLAHPQEVRLY